MIAITGATGLLGQHVIENLLQTVPAGQIVAIVRNPAKGASLSRKGISVRQADYNDEASLIRALQGVEKLLLISSSEIGQRVTQHRNVINAAKSANVKFIAYTSLLHADTSPLGLHTEHVETEKMLADSGMPFCAMAGIRKTIWPVYLLHLSMVSLLVRPEKAKSLSLPELIMRRLPPVLSVKTGMRVRCMSLPEMRPGH